MESRTSASGLAGHIAAMPGAISAPKLAQLLGVSRSYIYQLASDNRIPYLRIGHLLRFDPSAVAAWLRSKEVSV